MTQELTHAVQNRTARVVVIGMGYVGLPVSALIAEAGFTVAGLDIREDRVSMIAEGISPIGGTEPGLAELVARVVASGRLRASTDYAICRDADIVLIAVDTPVDDNDHQPGYEALRAALTGLAEHAPSRALVIVESTLAPGTMRNVVEPALRRAGNRLLLVHCPERLTPGRLLRNIREMPRVVGGMSLVATELAIAFYRDFVRAPLEPADDLTAETVKTAENAYRDVQIAFANELALICEDLGTDVWRVRELVNQVPGRQVHLPGAGVGGHCIPKDPWLLLSGITKRLQPRLIPAARAINDAMPAHVVDLVIAALSGADLSITDARVAVLGYAYRENSDDTRNTPSAPVVGQLKALGADVRVHDPYVAGYEGDLTSALKEANCAVLMVAHEEYTRAQWPALVSAMSTPMLVDCRDILPETVAGARVIRLGDGRSFRPVDAVDQLPSDV